MRKAKKTKKAEIATFLTLGLVLVGAVLSLLSGVMVNRQKNIASNPRASYDIGMSGSLLSPSQKKSTITPTITPIPTASTNPNCFKPIPSPNKACCFCQNGNVRVYASSKARVNNCMSTPCTTEYYGNAYGAESWGYCNDDGGNYEGGGSCNPATTEESSIATTQAAGASSNKLCSSDNDCQSGYKCIPIPSGYGYKYCASPTPTPLTPGPEGGTEPPAGGGTGAPAGSTTSTCPPPALCSVKTNSAGYLTCGWGYKDLVDKSGKKVDCKIGNLIGKCCIPHIIGVTIYPSITTEPNYESYLCIEYCISTRQLSLNGNKKYYLSSVDGYYYDENYKIIYKIDDYCGCTKEITSLNQINNLVCVPLGGQNGTGGKVQLSCSFTGNSNDVIIIDGYHN